MTTPNPLHIANTAQSMARTAAGADAVVFNKVAMVCMGVMAASSVVQALQPLLRERNERHRHRHADEYSRGR